MLIPGLRVWGLGMAAEACVVVVVAVVAVVVVVRV